MLAIDVHSERTFQKKRSDISVHRANLAPPFLRGSELAFVQRAPVLEITSRAKGSRSWPLVALGACQEAATTRPGMIDFPGMSLVG